jgi:2,4-dienoyl-CoA reductase-like NADH-dependent reductase (Old Yellow Enzyme family)
VKLFEVTSIKGLRLRNRLVRSATWEGMAEEDGSVNERLIGLYEDLAEGGIGLIISSYLYVCPEGKQALGQIGIHDDRLVTGLKKLASAVHDRGGAIVGQLVHCGGQADSRISGLPTLAPSSLESPGYREKPEELSETQIRLIVDAFAQAGLRLRRAGFDGLQLHGAHGYLLSQFMSPLRNRRADDYGGSLEKRCRFACEVYAAIREAVGEDFPVMIKLNASDFWEGSTSEADASYLAGLLAEAGIDAIEVSGGTPASGPLGAARPDITSPEAEAYFLPQARTIRAAVPGIPLMLVGGIRSLEKIEEIVTEGGIDYFSMSRPLIREPGLPNRWRDGDRHPAECKSCLGCFRPARKGEGIRCVRKDPDGRPESQES